ncbi:TetR/AcrR family transcriptional regulator [Cellulomonas sp.]|uniref:TetR/AcrR family transcriptional regulator n=1 Tax=Cellulomonas sp. TaxID=40001 RepID=UPI003BACB287
MSLDQIAELAAKKPTQRMSGAQRREEILVAARTVFAERGYAASTDEVARAAGVSQPYVVRLFGTKRELFLEAYKVASGQIIEALTAVPAGPDAAVRMGDAYIGLLADRDLLRMVMHGFIAGADEEVGRVARHTLGEAFRLFQERSGEDEQAARLFVAQGMLINVLLAVDAPAHAGEDAGLDALVQCVQDDIADRRTA